MHLLLHKVEVLVDRLVPWVLIALLAAIVGELFFSSQYEALHTIADYIDWLVLIVFSADLSFKYNRVRNLKRFVRSHWLEIIATLPLFLIFRIFEIFRISEVVERGQIVAHEASAAGKLEREVSLITKEVTRAGKLSRTARMIRFLRIGSRFPRFLKAIPFYEQPTYEHHPHEKKR
jgi:hypothetical protein